MLSGLQKKYLIKPGLHEQLAFYKLETKDWSQTWKVFFQNAYIAFFGARKWRDLKFHKFL